MYAIRSYYVAHIGGDDFVAIFVKKDYIEIFNLIKSIQDEFKNDAISLYNEEDIKNKYIRITSYNVCYTKLLRIF